MPVRRICPPPVGITEVPGRVRITAPFGASEIEALRLMRTALMRSPLAQELESLRAGVSARLEALGFPPALGDYEILDAETIKPGAPGSWRAWAAPNSCEADQAGAAPPARCRHPALMRIHEGTVPWLLATALQKLNDVQAYISETRPRDLEDLVRASYRLGETIGHVKMKLGDVEELFLRGKREKESRRAGGQASGKERRRAREADRSRWQVEAAAIWQHDPTRLPNYVAERIRKTLAREKRANEELWVPAVNTIAKAIKHLKP